jgi:hypothetical protein
MRHCVWLGVVVLFSLLSGCDDDDDDLCTCDPNGRSCISPTEGTCGTCGGGGGVGDRGGRRDFTCHRFRKPAAPTPNGCERACAFREAFFEEPPAGAEAYIDLNGDGILDVASLVPGAPLVVVAMGYGDGTFHLHEELYVGGAPVDLVVHDINNDGMPDLMSASPEDDSVWILLGRGDGTFGDPLDHFAGHRPSLLAVDDVNGDGINDLVVVSDAAGAAALLAAGDGTFEIAEFCPCSP